MRKLNDPLVSLPGGVEPVCPEAGSPATVDSELWKNLSAEIGLEFDDLLRSFLAGVRERTRAIGIALRRQDAPALELAAHSLKGSGGSFGASRLAALGEEMEVLGRAGRFTEAAALLGPLQSEAERLHAEVVDWCERDRASTLDDRGWADAASTTTPQVC